MKPKDEKSLVDRAKALEKELAAKTRELEIEAALENVRSRSLAMHKSDELQEVVTCVFQQLKSLNIEMDSATIITNRQGANEWEFWVATKQNVYSICTIVPKDCDGANSSVQTIFDLWKGGLDFNKTLSRKVKDEIWSYLFEHSEFRNVPDDRKKFLLSIPGQTTSAAFSKNAQINLNRYCEKAFSENDNSILRRFTQIFEQVYTRFLDLQKAESQARDAEIELALERVRARTMAMQKSDELQEVVNTVFEMIESIGTKMDLVDILIFGEDTRDYELYIASSSAKTSKAISNKVKIPYTNHSISKDTIKARENGLGFFVNQYSFEEKNKWFNWAFKHSGFKHLPEKRKKEILSYPGFSASIALEKYSGIMLGNHSDRTFSEIENENLKRFAKVFEQTYTRFLDLQKAEAQAREAQIEAALERVRSSSMAMHHSENLKEVVTVTYDQIEALGFPIDVCTIDTEPANAKHIGLWIAVPGEAYPQEIHIPYLDHPSFRNYFNAKDSGQEFYTEILTKTEKNSYYRHFFKNTVLGDLMSEERKKTVLAAPGWIRSVALSKNTALSVINFREHVYTEGQNAILTRFCKVFEQAYTRFLDLQKSEAQAREAQVEAALERVRAASMAMHSAQEIQHCTSVVFQQLELLGIKPLRCGFAIAQSQNDEVFDIWSVTTNDEKTNVNVDGQINAMSHSIVKAIRSAWKANESMFSYDLSGTEMVEYFKSVTKDFHLPEADTPSEALPKRLVYYHAIFKYGTIYGAFFKPLPEEQIEILVRFSKVFEQTYTRFLDLQKAEAQAREAQIEAALEKVRGRAMAIRKSDELQEVLYIILDELKKFEFELYEFNIVIIDQSTHEISHWGSGMGDANLPAKIKIIPWDHPFLTDLIKDFEKGVAYRTYQLSGESLKDYLDVLFTETDFSYASDVYKKKIYELENVCVSHAMMKHGALEAAGAEPLPEEKADILRRFAKVIDLTYTRFDDLVQAEARTREAVKQASLDRVRGEIASMRSITDLDRITPLIWQELNALEVPFIRCGVMIMDEKNQKIQSHLATPDGKTLGIFDLSYDSEEIAQNAVPKWRRGEIHREHWDQDKFIRFMKRLLDSGQIKNPESYQGSSTPPESLDLHFVPFKQGMLYVGNTEALDVGEINLVRDIANAFSIAYARYEDFRKLEDTKLKIEQTLEELKSTQSQLIHSEKMASLGELTAGIAHEIQNPLNFVNNFSEVSKELAEELKEESTKEVLDQELIAEIASDIVDNQTKINHHGQRASGIVKGMLEHSRTGDGVKEPTDLNTLADEYLRLAYHGLRAKDNSFNADFQTDFDKALPKVNVVPQDIGRVLLNLINNAFYAVDKRAKEGIEGYKPQVIISTKKGDKSIEICVKDNGEGIPEQVRDKIFQPFFTTKPTGSGTGLGLSLSYDIVKAHGGELRVESSDGKGSEFIIQLS